MIVQPLAIYTSVSDLGCAASDRLWFSFFCLGSGLMMLFATAKIGLAVRRIVFLDRLDASASVLHDLVDVRAFHQAETNARVPQAASGARPSVAVNAQIFLVQNRLEQLARPFWKYQVGRFRQTQLLGFVCRGAGFTRRLRMREQDGVRLSGARTDARLQACRASCKQKFHVGSPIS